MLIYRTSEVREAFKSIQLNLCTGLYIFVGIPNSRIAQSSYKETRSAVLMWFISTACCFLASVSMLVLLRDSFPYFFAFFADTLLT